MSRDRRQVKPLRGPCALLRFQDLNPDGACGNAAGAVAEKKERLLERGVEHFIAMLREIDRMSAKDLDAFPA